MKDLSIKEQIKELDAVINQLTWELTDLSSQENKINLQYLETRIPTSPIVRAQIRQKILDKKLEIREKDAERKRLKLERQNYVNGSEVLLAMLRTICDEQGHPEYAEMAKERIGSFKDFAGIARNESIPTAVYEEKFSRFA